MGYILLSPKHTKNVENNFQSNRQGWHLFDASSFSDNEIKGFYYKINNSIPLCKKENIHPIKNEFKDFESSYKDFGIELVYNYDKNNKENDDYTEYDYDNYVIPEVNGYYYTEESNNTFYYSDKKLIIRAIASILGEIVCEECLATLYGNKSK